MDDGNVGQVVRMISVGGPNYDIRPAARYEYDPYGNRINAPAENEYDQPLRFSTKPWDPETGLGCWGYRYYAPRLGRWVSRDPIAESGAVLARNGSAPPFIAFDSMADGSGQYGYVGNKPMNFVDPLGLCPRMEGMRLARAAIREPNPYAYVLNSPANANDPIGLKCAPPNGCSYSPDYPLGFNFKPCCDDHDRCYCTCGKTQPECDDAFERCLLRVCDRYLDIAEQTGQLGTPWGEWLVNLHFQTCRGLAHTYAGAVRSYGGGAFEAAQRAEDCCP